MVGKVRIAILPADRAFWFCWKTLRLSFELLRAWLYRRNERRSGWNG